MSTSTGGIARANAPGVPVSEYNKLPIGNGQTVGDLGGDALRKRCEQLRVPGVSASAGREENAAAYAREYHRHHDEAGKAALQEWWAA